MRKTNFFSLLAVISLFTGMSFISCKSEEPDPDAGKIDPKTIATESLIAHFPFDTNGDDAVASLKPKNVITAKFVIGQRGNCYQGAEGAYLLYPLTAASKLATMTQGFTVSTWIKQPKVYGDPVPMIFQIGRSDDHFWGNLTWMNERAGNAETGASIDSLYYKFCFKAGGVDNTKWLADGFYKKFAADQWQYVTLTYDGTSSKFSVYINGILYTERSKDLDPATAGLLTFSNVDYMVIGGWLTKVLDNATDAWMGSFKGSLDELRVYNAALSATNVKSLYDAEVTQLN